MSVDDPLISVILPIYNSEKYLRRSLDSVVGQTYSNIEIILIDDGSYDNSLVICEEYARMDHRIKITKQENKGIAATRNVGIEKCTGDYLCYVDSDDEVDINMIENYVDVISEYNPDIIISNINVYSKGNVTFRELRNDLPYSRLLEKKEIITNTIKPFFGGTMGIIPATYNKCYKAELIKTNHLMFDISMKRSEDYWFNFYAFQKAQSVFAIDKAFYHYYVNEGSLMRSFREGQFDDFMKNRKKLLSEHKKFNFPINYQGLNNDFVRNINELILLEIKVKGINKATKNIRYYLSNKEFQDIYAQSNLPQKHVQGLKYFVSRNWIIPALSLYYLWSIKANRI